MKGQERPMKSEIDKLSMHIFVAYAYANVLKFLPLMDFKTRYFHCHKPFKNIKIMSPAYAKILNNDDVS